MFSPLLVATFDPHGSLAKLEIEDVVTWGTKGSHIYTSHGKKPKRNITL
jgi:hypothetical protein